MHCGGGGVDGAPAVVLSDTIQLPFDKSPLQTENVAHFVAVALLFPDPRLIVGAMFGGTYPVFAVHLGSRLGRGGCDEKADRAFIRNCAAAPTFVPAKSLING